MVNLRILRLFSPEGGEHGPPMPLLDQPLITSANMSRDPLVGVASYLWQSRIEIEYYFIAYFERITEFDAL